MENPADEPEILNAVLREMSGSAAVITYNANSFVIPFFFNRLIKQGLDFLTPFFRSMGAYRLLRTSLPGAKNGAASPKNRREHILSADKKEDKIGEEECICLYNEHVRTGRKELKSLIQTSLNYLSP